MLGQCVCWSVSVVVCVLVSVFNCVLVSVFSFVLVSAFSLCWSVSLVLCWSVSVVVGVVQCLNSSPPPHGDGWLHYCLVFLAARLSRKSA